MTRQSKCCTKTLADQTRSAHYQNSHPHIVQEEMRGATMAAAGKPDRAPCQAPNRSSKVLL